MIDDFTRKGHLDLLATQADDTVNLQQGDGIDTVYTYPSTIYEETVVQLIPLNVRAVDLYLDGRLNGVVTHYSSKTVSILQGLQGRIFPWLSTRQLGRLPERWARETSTAMAMWSL